ncbi:TetR/AcrR family transcriptional regulator [Solimonas sp. K1W22B-7]|uniref:TetR/AcrR family transcriptional regulator n=1 Tax=Solimonas sp. K1W22B-7 TaxID=2303331 RepID=UPI000E330E24|nr:TetR/AcrR family transcriptional regulator [Solimonas sp. K1W22B-7]AXQ27471.1 TetR/AcrR family transcriptional regulator [Solimonas sp. K1W22B-7]
MSTASVSKKKESEAPPAPRLSARDRIFNAAKDLFYRNGIRAVGVESIATEAQTTKMSLYRSFTCKDDLVVEYLRESVRDYWIWWDEIVAKHPGDPRAALQAMFDSQASKACTCDTRGCAIGNASVELTEENHPGREVVTEFNRQKLERLTGLCAQAGYQQPDALARGLFLLMDGAYMSLLSLGADGPTSALPLTAKTLLDAHSRA